MSATTLARAALPIVAIVVFVGALALVIAAAGDSLGFDYLTYEVAARRFLAGGPVYDLSFTHSGPFGLFDYPPPFLLVIAANAALFSPEVATWVWMLAGIAAFVVGVAILPVRRETRWLVLLLAGLMWPFLYAVKLGQVLPFLFLLYAVGWRWVEDDRVVGLVAAIGTATKLQPAIVFVWAALRRRWTALVVGAVALLALALVATIVTGVQTWSDYVTLIRNLAQPVDTPRNFTPGAIALEWGASQTVATATQLVWTVGVIAAVVYAALRLPADRSYLVTVVASQMLSPILWDHYAMLLLLPVAWLLDRRLWWAALVPLVLGLPVVELTPRVAYPICFAVMLVAPLVVGGRGRAASAEGRPAPVAAPGGAG